MRPVSVGVHVKSVAVKAKVVKKDEYEEIIKLGTLVLEFDGDEVNADELVKFITERQIVLGLADTQISLDDAMRSHEREPAHTASDA